MAQIIINDKPGKILEKFTITCNKCSSADVEITVSAGTYPEHTWSSFDIKCTNCNTEEEIFDLSEDLRN